MEPKLIAEVIAVTQPDDEPNDDRPAERDESNDSLIPDADAGPTAAEQWSRDEKDHGRQDYGP